MTSKRREDDKTISFPTNSKEMRSLGWEQCDVIIITGDAFVDHPAFGAAIIARMLESKGYKVGIIPQPNWKDDKRDFRKLGMPRLFFGVTAGNMDSMVNHYTAHIRLRSDDAYTPDDKAGFRPDYAVTVYTKIIKSLFPETPVVIGGIEASLRRFVHYDYWADKLKPSVLLESGADILAYGMAEKSVCRIAEIYDKGTDPAEIRTIPQICFLSNKKEIESGHQYKTYLKLDSLSSFIASKTAFANTYKAFEEEVSKYTPAGMIQQQDENIYLVCNPPCPPLTENEMDEIYELPFTLEPHPRYRSKGKIPAYEMIRNSVTIHRGCFGGCSFCALTVHQGRFISSRSHKSVCNEVERLAKKEWFRGHISDLGGPSANMYAMVPENLKQCSNCRRPSCIYPSVCRNLNDDPVPLTELYRKILMHKGVKKISIGSGIRYDINLNEKSQYKALHYKYLEQLFTHHVSGYLKVAPEHSEDHILHEMRKPSFSVFCEFKELYDNFNRKNNSKQFLVPYIISSHPGCTLNDMKTLRKKLQKLHLSPEQVQDFMPTPMTLSSVIFYSGINPYTGKKVFTETRTERKKEQKNVFFTY